MINPNKPRRTLATLRLVEAVDECRHGRNMREHRRQNGSRQQKKPWCYLVFAWFMRFLQPSHDDANRLCRLRDALSFLIDAELRMNRHTKLCIAGILLVWLENAFGLSLRSIESLLNSLVTSQRRLDCIVDHTRNTLIFIG